VQGGVPATLGYQPPGYPAYPASLCTSLNDVVCHGIPDDRPLKNGDIVNIDVTVIKDGWHGDNSRMYIVGEGSIAAKRLCQITFEAMWKGIVKVARRAPGRHRPRHPDLRRTRRLLGGARVLRPRRRRAFHEEPQVLHYGRPGTLEELVPGMIFTIEPMINAGRRDIKEDRKGNRPYDGWTIVTRDRSLSAQWEHTVLVTETGYEVLTVSAGSPPPPAFATAGYGAATQPRSRAAPCPAAPAEPLWPAPCRAAAGPSAGGSARAFATARRRCWSTSRAARHGAGANHQLIRALARMSTPRWPSCGSSRMPARPRWWPWAATAAASCSRTPTSTCWCCCPTARTPTAVQGTIEALHHRLLGHRAGDRLVGAHGRRMRGRGQRDVTVQTACSRAAWCAAPGACSTLSQAHWPAMDPRAFLRAKTLEMRQRHVKYEDTPYALEPNCKESPGGLRDLQVVIWVARAAGLGRTWAELAAKGLITPFRGQQLQQATKAR
jgi:methionyl aminopeptidase